ncbi:hypothetical protein, partial [Escherichia coli]|uniref:hypothetical protein n=1 Tax=Escherichia coli TaxID=562 RepID=UPI0014135964
EVSLLKNVLSEIKNQQQMINALSCKVDAAVSLLSHHNDKDDDDKKGESKQKRKMDVPAIVVSSQPPQVQQTSQREVRKTKPADKGKGKAVVQSEVLGSTEVIKEVQQSSTTQPSGSAPAIPTKASEKSA